MHTQAMIDALVVHQCIDDLEQTHRHAARNFIERNPNAWWRRTTLEGHVTASAWVIDETRTHALLLHHAKLDRWLQPGGHIDDSDDSPYEAALREAREESGLNSLSLDSGHLFDIDVHPIPAKGNEPAHLHYDVRYLIIAHDADVKLSAESLGFRWLPLLQLTGATIEPSLARMAQKSRLR